MTPEEKEMRQKIVALIETGDQQNIQLAQLLCKGQGLPFQKLFRDAWGELLLACEYDIGPKQLGWLMQVSVLSLDLSFTVRGNALPRGVEKLTNLRSLYIYGKLTKLPETVRQLTNLVVLSFNSCGLTEIPAWIGELVELREICCNDNLLAELPESIGKLTKLQYLYCSKNRLKALPESLAQLTKLRILHCKNNLLAELPAWIEGSASLRVFDFEGNLF